MQHKSRDFSVQDLLDLIRTGSIALPEFQRPFVWEPSRVLELLDSVLNGWPIGSLLLLEGPQPFRIREVDGATEVVPDDVELYLLDGQQRVTALFHALTGSSRTVYYADFNEADEDGLPMLSWGPRDAFDHNIAASRKVPFESLMDDEVFDHLLEVLSDQESEWLLNARQVFGEESDKGAYLIPAIVMERSISLEALTRIFETLNRTGVRLNSFDLMVAVLYPSGFNLREEWELAKARFDILETFNANGLEILKLIALWQRDNDLVTKERPASRRVTGVRQRDVLNIPPDRVEHLWPTAVRRYVEALEFLFEKCGIRGGDGVPSSAMVLTISYFIEERVKVDKLTAWYWSSIALQTYSQGANTQIIKDVRLGTPPVVAQESVVSSLQASLLDESRRNKILRLGLRGLSILHDDKDVLTNQALTAPIVEVSMSALLNNQVVLDGDAPVADLVFLNKESVGSLRKLKAQGTELERELCAGALSTQGFIESKSYSISERATELANRVLARLNDDA